MDIKKVFSAPYVRELLSLLTSWTAEHPLEYLERWNCEEILDELTTIPFEYADGASRIAISHKSWDFVIKIDHCEYGDSDACYRESCIYEDAKKYGVEDALLPIVEWIDIGLPNGSLYIQQKAEYMWKNMPDDLDRKITKIYEDSEDVPRDIYFNKTATRYICYLIKYYGEDFVRRMVKWADKCRVNDLHGGNCGFVGETPKLLDYAGFWEW